LTQYYVIKNGADKLKVVFNSALFNCIIFIQILECFYEILMERTVFDKKIEENQKNLLDAMK